MKPKFKAGDIIRHVGGYGFSICRISKAMRNCYLAEYFHENPSGDVVRTTNTFSLLIVDNWEIINNEDAVAFEKLVLKWQLCEIIEK